jgi:ribosomal protein S9
MHKLITLATLAVLTVALCTTGCATKSRTVDIRGMFVSESGQLAIGYAHVDAIPEGTDSAVIHYKEDTALLSPSTKTHAIDITLTGTNSVGSASAIVDKICKAFVAVAPSIAKTNAESEAKGAMSPIDPKAATN